MSAGVSITGATGANAELVNGSYTETTTVVNGKKVWHKVTDKAKCLFRSSNSKWMVGSTAEVLAGKNSGWAEIKESGLSTPYAGRQQEWQVWDGSRWVNQPAVTATSLTKLQIDSIEGDNGYLIHGISGGANTENISGQYKKTAKVVNGKPVYQKTSDSSKSLFLNSSWKWMVADTVDVAASKSFGYASLNQAHLPAPSYFDASAPRLCINVSATAKWNVWNNSTKSWKLQSSMKVEAVSKAFIDAVTDIAMYEIQGCTGAKASIVNGRYKITSRRVNGWPVYTKVGDASKSFFYNSTSNWMVTNMDEVAADASAGFAYEDQMSDGGYHSLTWKVSDGGWKVQSSIKCSSRTKAKLKAERSRDQQKRQLGLTTFKSNPLYDSDDSDDSEYGFADEDDIVRAAVFSGAKYASAMKVVKAGFTKGTLDNLMRHGEACQKDIDALEVMVKVWLLNPKVWQIGTHSTDLGFKVLPNDIIITTDEPSRAARRDIMRYVKRMQGSSGSVKALADLIAQITEIAFKQLAGPVLNLGGDSGDLAATFYVPSTFAGKISSEEVGRAHWTSHVAAVMKIAFDLRQAAIKVGGKPITCVSNLFEDKVINAGVQHQHGRCNYEQYQYAECIGQAAAFVASMNRVFQNNASIGIVKFTDLKSTNRFNSKREEYVEGGKANPSTQNMKDILRCTVNCKGHSQMGKAVRLVEANLDVISTKDRVMLPTHDVLSVVKLKNGVLAEVQFAFETIAAIKSLAHGAYNYGRVDTWTDIEDGQGLNALFLKSWVNPPSIVDNTTHKFHAGMADVDPSDFALVGLRK